MKTTSPSTLTANKVYLRARTHLRVGDAEDVARCKENTDIEFNSLRWSCEERNANKYYWAEKEDCTYADARRIYYEFCDKYFA